MCLIVPFAVLFVPWGGLMGWGGGVGRKLFSVDGQVKCNMLFTVLLKEIKD